MEEETEKEFKPFHETYETLMSLLVLGTSYPNPETGKWSLFSISLFILTSSPYVGMILIDVAKCWNTGQLFEVIRHVAVMAPFILGFMKRILLFHGRRSAKEMLDMLNRDYESYNSYPENEKLFIKKYIKNTHAFHYLWIGCVSFVCSCFLVVPTFHNAYEYLFRSEPQRHMIYDLSLPGKEFGTSLESPFFEILYVYMAYIGIVYLINLTGYDGLMITFINHSCMRLELFGRAVNAAMKYEGEELRRRMAVAIKHQADTFKFIERCQSMYNTFLGIIYVSVNIQLCVCLYLVTESFDFDYKFAAFYIGFVLQMYVPCHIADKLKCVSEESATLIYCCGWEHNYDLSVRRYIPFMIARAQRAIVLKGFGLVTYEMGLFVSSVKVGYSLYTLIKSR